MPSDEVGQIKETFKETQKTDHQEINKKPQCIVGVVAVAALLILAAR